MAPRDIDERRFRPEPLPLRVIDRISSVAAVAAGFALVALALNVAADVLARATTGRPLQQTLELTTFWWMPLLIALSYALTEREREHITVTLLLDRLPDRTRRYVEGSFTALGAALVVLLAWYATADAIAATEVRLAAPSTPPLAYWPAKILGATGLWLLALQLAASTYRNFSGNVYDNEMPIEGEAV